jgi:hypothetical protein
LWRSRQLTLDSPTLSKESLARASSRCRLLPGALIETVPFVVVQGPPSSRYSTRLTPDASVAETEKTTGFARGLL